MVSAYHQYMMVGYWATILLLEIVSFFPIAYLMFKKRNKLAFPFILYLWMILIEIISTILANAYWLIYWRPDSDGYEPIALFTVSFISYMSVPFVSAAVFFLLLNRIFAVCFVDSRKIDTVFRYISIVFLTLMAISNTVYLIVNFLKTLPKLGPKCATLNCAIGVDGSVGVSWCRMVFGFANAFLGIIFLILLKKSSTSLQSMKVNRLTLITIASELFLSFFPTAIYIFLSNYFRIYLGEIIGPLGFLTCAVDTFIVAVIYFKFLKQSQRRSTVIINNNNLMK